MEHGPSACAFFMPAPRSGSPGAAFAGPARAIEGRGVGCIGSPLMIWFARWGGDVDYQPPKASENGQNRGLLGSYGTLGSELCDAASFYQNSGVYVLTGWLKSLR